MWVGLPDFSQKGHRTLLRPLSLPSHIHVRTLYCFLCRYATWRCTSLARSSVRFAGATHTPTSSWTDTRTSRTRRRYILHTAGVISGNILLTRAVVPRVPGSLHFVCRFLWLCFFESIGQIFVLGTIAYFYALQLMILYAPTKCSWG